MHRKPFTQYPPQEKPLLESFEKGLLEKEAYERKMARENYIQGIQGRDGGCFPNQDHETSDY